MNSNESLFEKIDNFLANKKSSEITLLFFMLFIFIAFISYSYVYPVTNKKLKITKQNLVKISKKLKSEKDYLRSVSRNGDEKYLIKKAKKEIESAKILLEKTTYANRYVDTKLKKLSYLLFNNKNWAKFLDSITYLAKENRVEIKILENKINKPNLQKIEQVLTVKVSFIGNFKDIMKFINSIEESKLVVDIFEMQLKALTKVEGYINVAVWGMKY